MVEKKIKELKTYDKNPTYQFEHQPKRFLKLYEDIKENGFDYKKSNIWVTSDYHIINGHHRHQILKKLYGEDFKVKIHRLPINKLTFSIITFLLFITILPILILFYLINRLIKILRNFKK